MEHRNGGDPLAPPRPPKSLPIVHRLRATETPMMNAPLTDNNNRNNITERSNINRSILTAQRHNSSSNNTSNLNQLSPVVHQRVNHQQQQQQQQQQQHHTITTAPLTPLQQQPITTFSRRRQPPPPVSPIPSLSSNIHNSETPVSPVTLAAPRPNNERLANEYVDTPFRGVPHPTSRAPTTLSSSNTLNVSSTTPTSGNVSTVVQHGGTQKYNVPHNLSSSSITSSVGQNINNNNNNNNNTTASSRATRPSVLPLSTAVTKQPLSSTFSKDITPTSIDDVDIHPTNGDILNSITCPQCKRCRCEECQRPRQLPSRWMCDDTCLCSAETAIDYASCLCCVKALYYHCSKDHEMDRETNSISCADDPCSCNSYNRVSRWSCLAVLSVCLPCLLCYWPMRGCVALCASCYARHSRHGCRCQYNNKSQIHNNSQTSSSIGNSNTILQNSGIHRTNILHNHHNHRTNNELTPEKRLLDSSPEF